MTNNTLFLIDDQSAQVQVRAEILGKLGFSLQKKTVPDIKCVTLTPAIAKELLTLNMNNRRIQQRRIISLRAELAKGFFVGENSIKFDWDGVLLDGQHRLTAIASMNDDFRMQIFMSVNNDPNMRWVIDTGRRRSVGDTLTIMGYKKGTYFHGIVKGALVGQKLKFKNKTAQKRACCLFEPRRAFNTREIESFYRQFKDGFDFVIELTGKGMHRMGVPMTSAMRGVILRAFYHENHQKLTRFVKVYLTGIAEEDMKLDQINSINKLRTKLAQQHVKKDELLLYRLFEKAMFQFCIGYPVVTFNPTPIELYPIPEFDRVNSINSITQE